MTAGKVPGKGSNKMNMKCAKVKRMLSLVLDNEAPIAVLAQVEQHIARCDACRREFEELKALKRLLISVPAPEMPSYLTAKTIARLRETEDSYRPVISVLWRIAAVLLIAVGLGLGVVIGRGLAGNGVISEEIATLNAEPSFEQFLTGER